MTSEFRRGGPWSIFVAWSAGHYSLMVAPMLQKKIKNKNIYIPLYTLPETNIAPENGWLEYYFPIEMAYFQGLLLLISGSVYIFIYIYT